MFGGLELTFKKGLKAVLMVGQRFQSVQGVSEISEFSDYSHSGGPTPSCRVEDQSKTLYNSLSLFGSINVIPFLTIFVPFTKF